MRSILFASSDPFFMKRISRLIEASLPAYSLQHAADVDEIFDALDRCPDVILMDSELPGYSGYRITNAIKAVTTQFPIIQLLDYDLQESKKTALEFGADHLIIKDKMMEARLTELLSGCC